MTDIIEACESRFCTAINCMDGRVQLPVITYLKNHFNAEFVDSVTSAGPAKTLAEGVRTSTIRSIMRRVRISLEKHGSIGLAVVAHADCAANPAGRDAQVLQVERAIKLLQEEFPQAGVIGLWVNDAWEVEKIA